MSRSCIFGFILLALIFPGIEATLCQESAKQELIMQQVNPDFKLSAFGEMKDARVEVIEVQDINQGQKLPAPINRDEAFKLAGVWPQVQGWGHLERDQLFMRAKEYSPDEFKTYYPKWNEASLIKLQKVVKGGDD